MKPRHLIALACALVVARVVFRVTGADAHVCIAAGMPLSTESFVLGPIALALAIATPVVAPTLVLATALLALSNTFPHEARFNGDFWRRFTKRPIFQRIVRGPPDA